jgi:integrase
LMEAVSRVCQKEDEPHNSKTNLKLAIGYLIKKAAEVMIGEYIIENDEEHYEMVKRFLEVLKIQWGELFSECLYAVLRRRQETLRKPKELPDEDDLGLLRNYCLEKIDEFLKDTYDLFTCHQFTKLRAVIVTRLTIFNARRGSEPARLRISEWETAERGDWIDPQAIANASVDEQEILSRYRLAYQSGKGIRGVVPLLIPEDVVSGIKKLLDVREHVGVHKDNPYVFPYLQQSLDHVLGWHEMQAVCKDAKVMQPKLITAHRIRHRAATVHASLPASNAQREAFFRHMGHSRNIDENVYQCPLGVTEVLTVGEYLNALDQGRVTGITLHHLIHSLRHSVSSY